MDSDKETGNSSDGIERASLRPDISATRPNGGLSKKEVQDEKPPGHDASILSSAGSTRIISEIPNGGLMAWLQVVGSFFLFFNSWGIVNTFGVYQTFYQGNLLSSESPSNISWIGAIQAYLLLLVSVIVGPLFDAGHFRSLLLVGTFFAVFGTMMLSISTDYWQVMLAQALCVGIGCGCLFVPSVAIVPTYFTTKKALATGIAASGSSLGV
ncbi:hypothetical protein B7494_g4213 [Chlorociboria aeruginascens]|nr:hypothetical protein B7494_g4213 [Chlorociboria aeruginascens]